MLLFRATIILFLCLSQCQYNDAIKNLFFIKSEHITLKNWKQITPNSSNSDWPQVENKDTSGDRFYFVQGNADQFSEDKPFLKLKENFFENDTLLSDDNIETQFKYWSNSKATHFKSTIDRSKHYQLNAAHQWASLPSQPVTINRYQWPRYEFYNDQQFTFALKEVKVQYIDTKPNFTKTNKFSLTAFNNQKQSLENIEEIDLKKVDIMNTNHKNVNNIIQVIDSHCTLNFSNTFLKINNWNLIEFNFKLFENNIVYKIKIENEVIGNYHNNKYFKITNPLENSTITFMYDKKSFFYLLYISILDINLDIHYGFAIWNTFVNKINYNPNDLMTQYFPNEFLKKSEFKTFKLLQTLTRVSKISFTVFSNNSKQCFTLFKMIPNTSVKIFITFEGDQVGRQTLTFKKDPNMFFSKCLSSFFQMQRFGRIQLTFLFKNENLVSELEKFIFLTWTENLNKNNVLFVTKQLQIIKKFKPDSYEWFYNNNNLFNYTFIKNLIYSTPVYVCDIFINCFPFVKLDELSNGTNAKFGLKKQVQNFLQNSPVIRLQCADENTEIEYFKANEVSFLKLKQHFVSQKDLHIVDNENVWYTMLVSQQKVISIDVPLNGIDLRVQSIKLSVQSFSTDFQIHLVALKVNGKNKIENLFFNYGQKLEISTNEIFRLKTHETNNQNANLITVFIKILTENPFIHLIENVNLTVNYKIFTTDSYPNTMGNFPVFESFPNEWNTITAKLDWQNNRILYLSDWVDEAYNGLNLSMVSMKMHLRFTVINGNFLLSSEQLNVTRLMFYSLALHNPVSYPLNINFNGHLGSILDELDDDATRRSVAKGPFRLGYLIEWKKDNSTGVLNVEIETSEIKIDYSLAKECPERGPSFASLNCHDVDYQCPPYYFSFNSTTGQCTRVSVPTYVEELCDADQGCANIFDRPLMSSTIYAPSSSSNISNAFFPTTFSATNQYLKVSRSAAEALSTANFFCLHFDYTAYHMKLRVSDTEPTTGKENDLNQITFAHKDGGHWFRDQVVCASQLNEEPAKVEAVYFSFQSQPEHAGGSTSFDIESHMIANLRYSA